VVEEALELFCLEKPDTARGEEALEAASPQ
jgi:hypothetical protein